jgi:hypothetical protein
MTAAIVVFFVIWIVLPMIISVAKGEHDIYKAAYKTNHIGWLLAGLVAAILIATLDYIM